MGIYCSLCVHFCQRSPYVPLSSLFDIFHFKYGRFSSREGSCLMPRVVSGRTGYVYQAVPPFGRNVYLANFKKRMYTGPPLSQNLVQNQKWFLKPKKSLTPGEALAKFLLEARVFHAPFLGTLSFFQCMGRVFTLIFFIYKRATSIFSPIFNFLKSFFVFWTMKGASYPRYAARWAIIFTRGCRWGEKNLAFFTFCVAPPWQFGDSFENEHTCFKVKSKNKKFLRVPGKRCPNFFGFAHFSGHQNKKDCFWLVFSVAPVFTCTSYPYGCLSFSCSTVIFLWSYCTAPQSMGSLLPAIQGAPNFYFSRLAFP